MADTQPILQEELKPEDNVAPAAAAAAAAPENEDEPSAKRTNKRKGPFKTREMRLEQNRKAARESRKRKKVLVEELQRSVIFFSRANGTLRSQNEEMEQMLLSVQAQLQGSGMGAMTPNVASVVSSPWAMVGGQQQGFPSQPQQAPAPSASQEKASSNEAPMASVQPPQPQQPQPQPPQVMNNPALTNWMNLQAAAMANPNMMSFMGGIPNMNMMSFGFPAFMSPQPQMQGSSGQVQPQPQQVVNNPLANMGPSPGIMNQSSSS